jgi:hypothetical protein
MTCTIDGCDNARKYQATGWCQTHYHRYWRTGSTSLLPKPLRGDLTYYGAHGRVKQVFGSATRCPCVLCGKPADEWAYDGTDPSAREGLAMSFPVTYSVWPEFYMSLCFPCHRSKDARARAARRTHFGCGHEITSENTYSRPGRTERACRTCRAASGAARCQARTAAKAVKEEPA